MKSTTLGGAVVALTMAGAASAATVVPVSYSMRNGQTGSYEYWDQIYDAPGAPVTTSLAPLSGGRGDLTDGVIAKSNWNYVEAPPGNGPYVGWSTIHPVITFYFDRPYSFTSVTVHFDDSNGGGGVSPPRGVSVNGGAEQSIADRPSGLPFSYTASLAAIATDQITLQLFRRTEWIMVSEVSFEAPTGVVPVPATLPLLAM